MNIPQKQLNQQREYIIKHFPDVCQIVPRNSDTPVVTAAGVLQKQTPAPRVWRSLTNIPCRVDFVSAFRPAKLPNQNTTSDEYRIHLPYDLVYESSDIIYVEGEAYEQRKARDVSNWDIFIEVVLSKLGEAENV
jgi:hypothetical protein